MALDSIGPNLCVWVSIFKHLYCISLYVIREEPHYDECHNCLNMILEPKTIINSEIIVLFHWGINFSLNACEVKSNEWINEYLLHNQYIESYGKISVSHRSHSIFLVFIFLSARFGSYSLYTIKLRLHSDI